MEYTVIKAEGLDVFINKVNNYIENGWICQGGVYTSSGIYWQAVIKKTEKKDYERTGDRKIHL